MNRPFQEQEQKIGGPDAADRNLERLLQLTRDTLTEQSWAAGEGELRRLQDRVTSPSPRLRWSVVAALAVMAAALPAAWLVLRRPAPLTFEVIHGTVGKGGEIHPVEAGTRIHFSDGSEIVLDQEAHTQVRDLAADGARIVLTHGRAHTFFMPRPHAHWQVAAGPYVVQVTGTVFDVEWSEENQALDVWLRKGSVTVRGPLIGGGVVMTRGQHLLTRIRDNKIVLDGQLDGQRDGHTNGQSSAEAPLSTATTVPESAEQETGAQGTGLLQDARPAEEMEAAEGDGDRPTSSVATRSLGHRETRGGPPPEHAWSRHLARGDFEAVIAAAERRGIDTVLTRGARRELGALADAARYTRRSALARRVLRAERERFPDSPEGREAAYFLGNLAEDEGAARSSRSAVTWFGRYLREEPSGTYSSQALGRTMVIHAGERGGGDARADAREYLRRFPAGSYAETARRIIKSQ